MDQSLSAASAGNVAASPNIRTILGNVICAQLEDTMADLGGRDPHVYMTPLFPPRNLPGGSPLFSLASNGNTVRDTAKIRLLGLAWRLAQGARLDRIGQGQPLVDRVPADLEIEAIGRLRVIALERRLVDIVLGDLVVRPQMRARCVDLCPQTS